MRFSVKRCKADPIAIRPFTTERFLMNLKIQNNLEMLTSVYISFQNH